MQYKIFDHIEARIDPEKIKRRVGLKEEEDLRLIEDMCQQAQMLAKPKAAIGIGFISELKENGVAVGDVFFESTLLASNLKETEKLIIYILTCGREIYDWAMTVEGFIEEYIAEQIKIEALINATEFFNRYIKEHIYPEKSSTMNPGSLQDWPLIEQKKLFMLLDGPAEKIGVTLTESCLMIPDKSVSGIVFQKEKSFINCMLCDRNNCPSRRAEYEGAKE